jgi:hypothetical protein
VHLVFIWSFRRYLFGALEVEKKEKEKTWGGR